MTDAQTSSSGLGSLTRDDDIPQGWVRAALPQIVSLNMGQSPPGSSYNESGTGVAFFQGKADFGARHPSVRIWCSAPKKMAYPGDILISVRAPVGPTNVADHECAIGRGLAALTPLGGIPTEFVLFALRLLEPQLALTGTGSTFTAISRKDLEAIDIPVPPLAEQNRIVDRVEALLARVNATRERLDKVPAILKRFRQSVLAAACSGRLTDSDTATWQRINLEEACREITVGHVGPMSNEYVQDGIPFLRSQNVRDFRFDATGLKYISARFHQRLKKTKLTPGDVVVVRSGNAGVACVVPPELKEANCADLVVIRPAEALNADFLTIYLNSAVARAHVESVKVGIAQGHFNIGEARSMPFMLPTLEEQREIVQRVMYLFRLASKFEKQVSSGASRAGNLTQAILAKAFRGELVPTEAELARRDGREYEPASVLLGRIGAARHLNTGVRHQAGVKRV